MKVDGYIVEYVNNMRVEGNSYYKVAIMDIFEDEKTANYVYESFADTEDLRPDEYAIRIQETLIYCDKNKIARYENLEPDITLDPDDKEDLYHIDGKLYKCVNRDYLDIYQ